MLKKKTEIKVIASQNSLAIKNKISNNNSNRKNITLRASDSFVGALVFMNEREKYHIKATLSVGVCLPCNNDNEKA